MPSTVKRVAVIGSGIGGLSAAHHAMQAGHQVDIYEADNRVGGHTWEVNIDGTMVDLGFMMAGDSNPNIRAWFASMGLEARCRVPMSMSVVGDDWVFSSRKPFSGIGDVINPKLWKLLIDIHRFVCHLLFSPPEAPGISTRQWCEKGTYSNWFYERYAMPFFAILWTIPAETTRSLPFSQFAACLRCHAQSLYLPLYQVVMGAMGMRTSKPSMEWHVFGSSYLAPFLKAFKAKEGNNVKLNAPVAKVARGGQSITLANGQTVAYDHVIVATHAEVTADLVQDWNPEAAAELRKYTFHQSRMLVHRDPSFLPADKQQWASWNVRVHDNEYIMTYYMNRIQHLPRGTADVFVSIIPKHGYTGPLPSPELTLMDFDWDHPKLLADCIPQTELLDEPGISLSGAWVGRGFHEDGFVAGRRAAACIDDEAAARTRLYEDADNIPVTWAKLPTTPLYLKALPVLALAGALWWKFH